MRNRFSVPVVVIIMETEGQKLKKVWTILYCTFGIVPIVAGLDKFTHVLTDWDKYLSPMVAQMLPVAPHAFMMAVGIIEVLAGIIVFIRPGVGAYIVMVWLIAIALQLILMMNYLDVAVRDLVMAISAFSLGKLSAIVLPGRT